MSIYDQALSMWKQSQGAPAPRSGVMAVVLNALDDMIAQNVDPVAFGIRAERDADAERERMFALEQAQLKREEEDKRREEDREFELQQSREKQAAEIERAKIGVETDDADISNTLSMLQSQYDSPTAMREAFDVGEDFGSAFSGQKRQRQSYSDGSDVGGVLDPMSEQSMASSIGMPSFAGMSEGWDDNIAPYLPPFLNAAPSGALGNLASLEGGIGQAWDTLMPQMDGAGDWLSQQFLPPVMQGAPQSAPQPQGIAQAPPVAPIAQEAVAPIQDALAPQAIDPMAAIMGMMPPEDMGAGQGLGDMMPPDAMPVDLPVASPEGDFAEFPLQDFFPMDSGGELFGDRTPVAGPLTESDAQVEDFIQEGRGAPVDGTGIMQMANGDVRTIDVRPFNERLTQIVEENSDNPIKQALAATGINPATMTVVRPRPDGTFTEVPIAGMLNQLSPSQRVAYDQFNNARQGLAAIEAETDGKARIAAAGSKGGSLFDFINTPNGLARTNDATGEAELVLPAGGKPSRTVELEYGKTGKKKSFRTTEDIQTMFGLLGANDPAKIGAELGKAIDEDFVEDAVKKTWGGATKYPATQAALLHRAAMEPDALVKFDDVVSNMKDGKEKTRAQELSARLKELIAAIGTQANTPTAPTGNTDGDTADQFLNF